MMGVYISGLQMPEDGAIKCIAIYPSGFVRTCFGKSLTKIATAIPVSDHGDLIDRGALMAKYAEEVAPSNNSDFIRPPRWNDAVQLTELSPVVIPAERNEDE